jgi:dTDP-4-dehydrorhamnose 3,5-epimerase
MGNLINIDGVILTDLKIIENPKGNIYHSMKSSDKGYCGFGEAYFSSINYKIIKAWKRHNKMTLNLTIPVGKVKFVFLDTRPESNTKGNTFEVILSKDNYKRITIPPGVWMGFQGLSEGLNLLLNVANIEHDPHEQENIPMEEFDFKYNW